MVETYTERKVRENNRCSCGKLIKRGSRKCKSCAYKGRKYSQEHNDKIRKKHIGQKASRKTRDKMSKSRMGDKNPMFGKKSAMKEQTMEAREKLRKANIGDKNPAWKGGVSLLTKRIRASMNYAIWRSTVFIRDGFICQDCGAKSGNGKAVYIEAHHKKPFAKLFKEAIAKYPLLKPYDACMLYAPLWDINNGETLCKKCHDKTKKGEK